MFLAYTAFCFWVVFLNGADVLAGWKSFFLFGWFEATLTVTELKFYITISWLASLVFTLYQLFSRPAA
jgi:hypothetical protein